MSAPWPQDDGKWFWFQPKDKSTGPEPHQCFFYDDWRYASAASEITNHNEWDYLGPCLTPAEVAAAVQAERAAWSGHGVIGEIATERRRQVAVEGWSLAHDDTHRAGELAMAGASYAVLGSGRSVPHGMWPWRNEGEWPKPETRRHDLVRAAALIIAEIERLDRITEIEDQP